MKVGFTGTRSGMSAAQEAQLTFLLLHGLNSTVTEFHHGAADGADSQAETLVNSLRSAHPHLLGHVRIHRWLTDDKPLQRNRKIVAHVDILIAAPRRDLEQLRSGTWATVRYARAAGKPVVMLSRGRPCRSSPCG